jgi:hypothetical protein
MTYSANRTRRVYPTRFTSTLGLDHEDADVQMCRCADVGQSSPNWGHCSGAAPVLLRFKSALILLGGRWCDNVLYGIDRTPFPPTTTTIRGWCRKSQLSACPEVLTRHQQGARRCSNTGMPVPEGYPGILASGILVFRDPFVPSAYMHSP